MEVHEIIWDCFLFAAIGVLFGIFFYLRVLNPEGITADEMNALPLLSTYEY